MSTPLFRNDFLDPLQWTTTELDLIKIVSCFMEESLVVCCHCFMTNRSITRQRAESLQSRASSMFLEECGAAALSCVMRLSAAHLRLSVVHVRGEVFTLLEALR